MSIEFEKLFQLDLPEPYKSKYQELMQASCQLAITDFDDVDAFCDLVLDLDISIERLRDVLGQQLINRLRDSKIGGDMQWLCQFLRRIVLEEELRTMSPVSNSIIAWIAWTHFHPVPSQFEVIKHVFAEIAEFIWHVLAGSRRVSPPQHLRPKQPSKGFVITEMLAILDGFAAWMEDTKHFVVCDASEIEATNPRVHGAKFELIAAELLRHHCSSESGINDEPLRNVQLHRKLNVSKGYISDFFKENFGSHSNYQSLLKHNPARLRSILEKLNGLQPELRERQRTGDIGVTDSRNVE